MTTVSQRLTIWRKSNLRGAHQVNEEVLLIWFQEAYTKLQKQFLEYVANQMQVGEIVKDIEAGEQEYILPTEDLTHGIDGDFYSIAQLRIAYKEKDGVPKYRICRPMSVSEYNMNPETGRQVGAPFIMRRVSYLNPGYHFEGKNKIKIYPKPKENVTAGLNMSFNFIRKEIKDTTVIEDLYIPWYFWDALDDYLSYKLILKENPEIAGMYLQQFNQTLHDNIYGSNKDQRAVEEEFADLRGLYIN